MAWTVTQETMRARNRLALTSMGVLGILVGAVLLRRPGPRWIALGTLADGALLACTGEGVILRAWNALRNGMTTPGETPARTEV